MGSNKRGREAQRQNMMPPSHHRLSHQIPVEAKRFALKAWLSPYIHSKYNVLKNGNVNRSEVASDLIT